MSNPFNALNPNNPMNNIAPFRDIYQAMKNSNNPMQLFSNIASKNPQLQPIMQMLRNGVSPQQVFTQLCQQRGINPQDFLKALNGM